MRRLVATLLLVCAVGATAVVAGEGGPPPAETSSQPSPSLDSAEWRQAAQPRITALYPNPVAEDDEGEFVRLWLPPETRVDHLRLSDGEGKATLSLHNSTATDGGRHVTVSADPAQTSELTGAQAGTLDGGVQLSNGGETVRLRRNGTVVDEVAYQTAPEGEVYHTRNRQWRPLNATDRPVVTAGGGTVEAFVLPDSPDRAVRFLRSATDRILLAGYTLTSRRVVDALRGAHARGVHVEVLVDGSPVGGRSERGATALDRLAQAGIPVDVVDGDRARVRFHHAKYAVVDDRALVTTENWKPAGTGGKGSRGWGVITGQQPVVEGLVDTYRADTDWVDAVPWQDVDASETVPAEPANQTYPTAFEARALPVEQTRLLVAPDNAREELRSLIESAEESVAVKQVSIGGPDLRLLQATLAAARRGVEVRILLSSAWYVEEDNRRLADWLEEQAAAGNLPLSVRLAEPDGRFEKIHAKGVIVDGETVALGSANWNQNSVTNNREVVLLLTGSEVASYFGAVFDADWGRGSGPSLPVGVVVACGIVAVLAVVVATRLRFEGE